MFLIFQVTQCPNPSALQTEEIILTESFTAEINFTTTIRLVKGNIRLYYVITNSF